MTGVPDVRNQAQPSRELRAENQYPAHWRLGCGHIAQAEGSAVSGRAKRFVAKEARAHCGSPSPTPPAGAVGSAATVPAGELRGRRCPLVDDRWKTEQNTRLGRCWERSTDRLTTFLVVTGLSPSPPTPPGGLRLGGGEASGRRAARAGLGWCIGRWLPIRRQLGRSGARSWLLGRRHRSDSSLPTAEDRAYGTA